MLSEDSKWRILKAVQRKEKVTEIARMFGITRGSVYDIVNQYKETGNLEIRTNQRGSKPKLDKEQLEEIRQAVTENPDIYSRLKTFSKKSISYFPIEND